MTGIEERRIDRRIRDLADLCSRHGTPCADGLLAEIDRLRTERDHARAEWHRHNERADMWRNEDRITRESLGLELERTTGDWEVAIREATDARAKLFELAVAINQAPINADTQREANAWNAIFTLVDAALDKRLAPETEATK